MSSRLRVYLDVGIGLNLSGRVVFEFFNDVSERLVENFKVLCQGDRTTSVRGRIRKLSYEGCKVFKVIKGEYLQCGDFINNDGTSGGSIYGDCFKEYPTNRLHSQAGLLSIQNINSNTDNVAGRRYGSQFCILFGKVVRFDRNNIVIGRVVEGMEFIRAIENVPVDNKFKPKIEIGILSCGAFTATIQNINDSTKQKELVQSLMDTIKSDQSGDKSDSTSTDDSNDLQPEWVGVKCVYTGKENRKRLPNESSANTLGKKLLSESLQGIKHHYIPIQSDTITHVTDSPVESTQDRVVKEQDTVESVEQGSVLHEEEPEEPEEEVDDDITLRLKKLSNKMNECSRLNNDEIIMEQKIKSNPKSELYISKNHISKSEGKDIDKDISSNLSRELNVSSNSIPLLSQLISPNTSYPYIISAGMVEKLSKIEKTKEKNKTFGWNIFNQDALYRAHKKRLRETGFNPDLYEKQKNELGEEFYRPGIVNFNPNEASKDVVVRNVEKQYKKRDAFSRRRLYDDEAQDISYINERNRVFNKKLERSFGTYSNEIKQNLERGTAL
ncbi:peptidylprolyl isomerase (cyclophilin), putative [Theileria annulata]|uniref:Peptidylprolyl isomerase (Cyclophilin), putative n=1 Tax=Theileria annulata TaxID=5874 RepID=Q4UCL3_THEAN|nr:peptidylprolyl isomerase (cyclophilin), putative [Theileria annulata]CAI75438.1 peptidylprolyl isomerase (cyclophilin), putative [Theileria annulata]|eukprot:XP_954914.1 peptidylprolyl isomerase (cyclophilin), putative [Theileria annulata]